MEQEEVLPSGEKKRKVSDSNNSKEPAIIQSKQTESSAPNQKQNDFTFS